MTKGIRSVGDFCWLNMLTPAPDAAREFYTSLLGWSYAEIPGMGHRIQVAGRDIGAVFDLNGPNTPPGTPPSIGLMVKVESADATRARAESLGGRSKAAFDIGEQGRMAELFDPNGAELDIWEPRRSPGTDVDAALHGAPSWFETMTTDPVRVAEFYSALFGWTATVLDRPGPAYTAFTHRGAVIAGTMAITPAMGPMRPHWSVYFTSADIEATARDAVTLGGMVCVPVTPIPDVGRFAGIVSPQGLRFYVFQP